VRTYRAARELLGKIEQALSAAPGRRQQSPLEEVAEILCSGRHFSWVGIYLSPSGNAQHFLSAGEPPQPGQLARPDSKSKVLISMSLAGRERGILTAESACENAFGAKDRVLLENATNLVVRFLAGRGKYLVRNARAMSATANAAKAS
jgi:hypothetical protein